MKQEHIVKVNFTSVPGATPEQLTALNKVSYARVIPGVQRDEHSDYRPQWIVYVEDPNCELHGLFCRWMMKEISSLAEAHLSVFGTAGKPIAEYSMTKMKINEVGDLAVDGNFSSTVNQFFVEFVGYSLSRSK
jgi:hypothetical protein